MPVSPHGLVIALLQFVAVLVLLWANQRWQERLVQHGEGPVKAKALLSALLVVEYAVLRVQPIRMGGDPFAYSLGIFDAVSVFGLVLLWWTPMRKRQL